MGPSPPPWLGALRKATTTQERIDLVGAAPPAWHETLGSLLDGPEPDQALVRAEGLPAPLWQTPWPARFSRLLHEGSYAARLAALDPTALLALDPTVTDPPPLDALRAAGATCSIDEALGRVRNREYLRLCAREVEGAELEEVGHALSSLCSACLQVLLEQFDLHEQVVVFGMGKLGGNELNFLSDIDLVFVHDDAVSDRETAERGQVARLHERLRRLVRHLEGQGKWRPLFRVDLRLRPFGSRGPLSTSVCATEAYYERHGRPWERQVWLRARPLAGRMDLGALLLRRLTPFVYRRSVGPEIFGEIADMMRRARREATRVGSEDGSVDLKLDVGGIREIEFTVQALQLLHGGRNPGVREPSTLPALDRLLAAGLVSDREHRELQQAYRWLRRVEHRLQLGEGQQTHRVPGPGPVLDRLVQRLHWPIREPGVALATFTAAMQTHRRRAQAIAQTIAGDEPHDDPHAHDIAVLLDEGAPRASRCAALERLGVHEPAETEALLEHLYTRADGPFTARGPARQGAENLLRACLDSADPEAAIHRLSELCASRPAHYAIWRAFADPGPIGRRTGLELLRLCGELLGASETLSRGLIGFPSGRLTGPAGPIDTAQAGRSRPSTPPDPTSSLLLRAGQAALPDPADLAADLEHQEPDPRGLDATLLRFKHEQLVRVGLHDLGRRPDPLAVGRAISDVADLVLRRLLLDCALEAGPGPRHSLAVLALGKHGMQAMDYGSDLDLMFVFEPRQDAAASRDQVGPVATKLAQRLMARLDSRALGLRLYEVDMRLRPSGRQGLLVTSRTGFARYHARQVAVWERLALLRLRPVAEVEIGGPVEAHHAHPSSAQPGPLGAAVRQVVARTLGFEADATEIDDTVGARERSASRPTPEEVQQETRRLKGRIEDELARESRKKGWYNAKTGEGGCLELELLVAALQLIHGPAHPGARATGIVEALTGLREAGAVLPDEASALCADYRFHRLLLNRLRMSPGRRGDDPDRFSENSPRLDTLARRMGLPSRVALLRRFHLARARVRAAFDRHLTGPPLG
ncbi:[protein-PII] uridylyltransferase family protein [Paraliomyxa miuraensis]|uniref:[protein-PII] uridylyltransferase family protein n=1 Tax=Paraliomyxa miuraensis TaxID=376150 RepID=UPI002251DF82|nr:hypothetical protein [Paraliomyxa miuraensis]MCX4243319.1 hypothetical protein [Paraliomyxa miuraensis]